MLVLLDFTIVPPPVNAVPAHPVAETGYTVAYSKTSHGKFDILTPKVSS